MTVIELPDEEALVLKAKAAAEGLSLEAWFKKLAEPAAAPVVAVEKPLQAAADIILSCMRNVPPPIMAAQPTDGASQHDHYIYGWPKKEA